MPCGFCNLPDQVMAETQLSEAMKCFETVVLKLVHCFETYETVNMVTSADQPLVLTVYKK